MANIRREFGDDLTLKNGNLGINTTTTQERVDVVGVVKGRDLNVTGVTSLTAYEGFLRADNQIVEETNLEFGNGLKASLSGEIIVGTGVTVTIGAVGLGTTSVGVGTYTIQSNIDTTDINLAGGSQIECLKVYNTFTPPSGGTNERPYAPKPGELYYNYDFKTIEFFDGYGWRQVDNTTRSGRAVFGGGYIDGDSRTKDMQLINIPTLGNATYFGDLARDLSTDGRGVGSAVRGILGGGYGKQTPGGSVDRLDDMDYFTIASEGNAIDFGNLTVARNGLGAVSSSTRGIFCGGASPSPATNSVNTMDYIQISTTGNALDFGDLAKEKSASGCLANSPTRGIVGAGDDYSNPAWQHTALGHLDAVTMASKGNAVDFGTDAVSRIQGGACGNAVRACFAGGYVTPQYSSGDAQREAGRAMTVISISTFGNSVEFGTLSSGPRIYLGAASSNTRGIWTGGSNYPVHFNEIEYTQFASLGDSIDFGDLTRNKGYMQAATSDSHGGLGGF